MYSIVKMDVDNVLNSLLSNIANIDLEEIKELDVVCKIIIKQAIEKSPSIELLQSVPLIKIQAILDYTYERINIGNWKGVRPYLRKTMTIASYLKLLIQLHQNSTISNDNKSLNIEILKEAFKTIDYGLLFGCPLEKDPKLLQKCAAILNKVYEETFFNNSSIEPDLEPELKHTKSQETNALTINEICQPSMELFYSNYILKEKPVLLSNCFDHWPALVKWKDQKHLLKLAGLRTVPIEIGSKYTDNEWTQKLMTLEDFIKNHIYNTENTTGYLAQYQLFEQIPELLKDISVPEYCCFSETDEDVDINAWYGPKGTVSPLHHDPKKNLLAQVVGEKSIYLFSPTDSEYLYPHDEELLNNTAKVDPRGVDLIKYPNYTKASPYHCILRSGQMLYIPPKWWHFVESMSISFSVSFWWT